MQQQQQHAGFRDHLRYAGNTGCLNKHVFDDKFNQNGDSFRQINKGAADFARLIVADKQNSILISGRSMKMSW